MEEEYLAPTEISFTTPFKQAFRAPNGNGNVNESYDDNQSYNCDDDDDLNFISNNFQRLALSEKKGWNKRQEASADSPVCDSTFVMGVAESKENSFQEESPSFLNFGDGKQSTSLTPGSSQKLQARSVHASPSCPNTSSTSVPLPSSSIAIANSATPPTEERTKNQSFTLEELHSEAEKIYLPDDINASDHDQSLPTIELNTSAQAKATGDSNIQNQAILPLAIISGEKEINQEQEQITHPVELNVSAHDVPEFVVDTQQTDASSPKPGISQDSKVDTLEQENRSIPLSVASHERIGDADISHHTPPRQISTQKYEIHQNFSLDSSSQNDLSRELTVSNQKQCAPEDPPVEILKQSTPVRETGAGLFSQPQLQNTQILELNVSAQKLQDVDIQTKRGEREILPQELDISIQEDQRQQDILKDAHKLSSPSRELNVSADERGDHLVVDHVQVKSSPLPESATQILKISQDFVVESVLQNTTPQEPIISTLQPDSHHTFMEILGQSSPQLELNVSGSNEGIQVDAQIEKVLPHEDTKVEVGIPQNVCVETPKRMSPPRELNATVNIQESVTRNEPKITSIEPSDVAKNKGDPHDVVQGAQIQRSPPRELTIPANVQVPVTPIELRIQSEPSEDITKIQDVPRDFVLETHVERSPPRELNVSYNIEEPVTRIDPQIQNEPSEDITESQDVPQDFVLETHVERSPPRELNVSYSIQEPVTRIEPQIQSSEPSEDMARNQGAPDDFDFATQVQRTSHHNFNVASTYQPIDTQVNKAEGIPLNFFMESQKQVTPPRKFNPSAEKEIKVVPTDLYIEPQKHITPPRELSTSVQTRSPLLCDFAASPLVNTFSTQKQGQSIPPRVLEVLPNKKTTSQDFEMEAQLQHTPPREQYFSEQNQRTPLLVDLNDSIRRPNRLQQVSWDEKQQEYSVSSNPSSSSQLHKQSTPPQSSEASTLVTSPEPALIGMRTPNPALKRLQDELLQQEALFQGQVDEKDEFIKMKELELNALYQKIDAAKAYKEKEGKMIKKYEGKIVAYTNELEKLRAAYAKSESKNVEVIKDRDQTYSDLQNVENAYNDLMGKYLRAKELVGVYADSEISLRARDEDLMNRMVLREQKIELLKNQIQEMVEMTYIEYDNKLREKRHENENLKVRLMRMEMRVDTLDNDLEQKTRENQQLSKLCDEIISGRVSA